MSGMKLRAVLCFLFSLFFVSPALPQASLKPALAALQAQASPSLWHIKGEQGEVYLLGSVHVLPPDLNWRTAPIAPGLSRSDIYVFVVPQDQTTLTQLNAL